MKKLTIISVILITTAYNAFAQKDADAQKILNAVSKKYKSYNMMKADFSFTLDEQMSNIKDTQVGTLISQPRANKFKVIIYSPEDKTTVTQEIISDGKSQWTYVKKDKEVELNNVDHSEDNLNPAQMFTLYEHGYKYIYNGEQKIDGKICQVIDLTPEDAKKQFFKVRLSIDKAKKQIYSAVIFDKNGSKYTYVIRTFTPNPKLPETIFTFDKKSYPGVEVVDLR
ncbi:MAG TPA: outer membrane lipoprotein carrier protein LolA [Mucilaginibacter sp.]|jgi:outer membrane lipoprotein-sorting protein|nr:outer membrane lipoprotein carrier protein LolA [Mucilaginibacter sp.]